MNDTKPAGEKKVGPIVATLIIVLILIIAALYLFASKVNQPAMPTDNAAQAANAAQAQADDLNSLQSDIDNSGANLDNQNF